MNEKTIFIDLLPAGFFAAACLRARPPFAGESQLRVKDFFRLSGALIGSADRGGLVFRGWHSCSY